MGKKGSAHLEMILSFTIFLVAVVFILVYIRPLESNKLSDVAVISLKSSFVEITQTSLTSILVNSTERCAPINDLNRNSTYQNISGNEDMYYALFSSEISTNMSACGGGTSVGSWTTSSAISDSSLRGMQNKYYSNYRGLKEDLKLPSMLEFEIYSSDNAYNMTRATGEEIDIISKRYTLSILNQRGELINKEFVFRVW